MKYFTKRTIFMLAWALVCVSTILFASCGKKKANETPLKIGINVWAGYAYAFVALEKGFFKENGVNVEFALAKDYSEVTELYRGGKVDGIFEVFADSVFHNFEGIPTKIVCVVDYSDTGDVIVASPEIKSILDLKERLVGIGGLNSFSHMFVLSILNKAGIKEEDMRFEITPPLDVVKALDEKKIYAGHTWEPTKSEALKKGYKIIAKAGDIPGIIVDVLSFKADIAKKRPDAIRAVIRALFQARDFVQTNRAEAVAIMAHAEGMTPEEMDSGLSGIVLPDYAQDKLIMMKSDNPMSLFNLGAMIYDFYGKRGRYYAEADLEDIIDPSFIEAKDK